MDSVLHGVSSGGRARALGPGGGRASLPGPPPVVVWQPAAYLAGGPRCPRRPLSSPVRARRQPLPLARRGGGAVSVSSGLRARG